MIDNKIPFWMILGFVLALIVVLLFVGAGFAHGATTSKQNVLGSVSYTSNPLMYNAGSVAEAKNIDGNLSLRFKPIGTYSLYDENVLLCGLPMEKFNGIHEPFLLTYRRQASRLVQGIGCHDLVRVDNMVTKEPQ